MSTLRTNAIQTVAGKPILNSTGSILQVVQQTYLTQVSTTSGSYTPNGLSAAIIPSSSTSKVFITATGNVQNDTANGGTYVALFKNGSFLWSSNLHQFSAGGNNICDYSISYLDSPATTSSITYAIYFARYNTGNSYTFHSAIQLMEVS
jgi:hypothetical protein